MEVDISDGLYFCFFGGAYDLVKVVDGDGAGGIAPYF